MTCCPICGNTVEVSKHAWNKTYCCPAHRLIAQHNRQRERKRVAAQQKASLTGLEPKYNGSMLSDLTIIEIDGQQRIKAAVMLEKLAGKKKHA